MKNNIAISFCFVIILTIITLLIMLGFKVRRAYNPAITENMMKKFLNNISSYYYANHRFPLNINEYIIEENLPENDYFGEKFIFISNSKTFTIISKGFDKKLDKNRNIDDIIVNFNISTGKIESNLNYKHRP